MRLVSQCPQRWRIHPGTEPCAPLVIQHAATNTVSRKFSSKRLDGLRIVSESHRNNPSLLSNGHHDHGHRPSKQLRWTGHLHAFSKIAAFRRLTCFAGTLMKRSPDEEVRDGQHLWPRGAFLRGLPRCACLLFYYGTRVLEPTLRSNSLRQVNSVEHMPSRFSLRLCPAV